MTVYNVYLVAHTLMTVEADDEDQAAEKACYMTRDPLHRWGNPLVADVEIKEVQER